MSGALTCTVTPLHITQCGRRGIRIVFALLVRILGGVDIESRTMSLKKSSTPRPFMRHDRTYASSDFAFFMVDVFYRLHELLRDIKHELGALGGFATDGVWFAL